jgi:SHS2 domain-containing protein
MNHYLKWGTLLFLSALVALSITLYINKPSFKESIIYFPIDPNVSFETVKTTLSLLAEKDDDEYIIDWETFSSIENKIYLHQDVSLLFEDGRLKDIMAKWKEDSLTLTQTTDVIGKESSHYTALTYHHAEIHYPDNKIKSSQAMSSDELYVIDSSFQPLDAFKEAETSEQKQWKKILDHAVIQQLTYSWTQLIEHYQIPKDKYILIPLTSLDNYGNKPLPGLTNQQSEKVVGNLWEGLYKNYILGLKGQSGTIKDAKNSVIPLILLSKNKTHLLVLIEGKDGEYYQLIQHFSF